MPETARALPTGPPEPGIEQAPQRLASPVQAGLDGAVRDLQNTAGFLGGKLLEIAKHQHRSVRLREAIDLLAEDPAGLGLLEDFLGRLPPPAARPRLVAGFVELRKEIFDRIFRLPPSGPEPHQAAVDRDPVQPGRQKRTALELAEGSTGGKERVLDGISSVLFIPQDPSAGSQKPRALLPHAPSSLLCAFAPAGGGSPVMTSRSVAEEF